MVPPSEDATQRRNESFSGTQKVISCVFIVFVALVLDRYFYLRKARELQNVDTWLSGNGLSRYLERFQENGITSMEKVATLSKLNLIRIFKLHYLKILRDDENKEDVEHILQARDKFVKYQQYLTWIEMNNLETWQSEFSRLGIHTLQDVVERVDVFKDNEKYLEIYPVIIELENHKDDLQSFEVFHTESLLWLILRWAWRTFKVVFVLLVVCLGILFACAALFVHVILQSFRRPNNNTTPSGQSNYRTTTSLFSLDGFIRALLNGRRNGPATARNNISGVDTPSSSSGGGSGGTQSRGFGSIFGFWFSAKKSKVTWLTTDYVVGNEVVIVVQFRRDNGMAYKASEIRAIKCEVFCQQTFIQNTVVFSKKKFDELEIRFTPTRAAEHTISIIAEGEYVGASPYKQQFQPGKIDPFKSSLVVPSCLLVLEQGKREMFTFDERDKFGNPCTSSLEELLNYQFFIYEFKESGKRITPPLSFDGDETYNTHDKRNKAWLTIADPGVYTADVFYDNRPMSENVILLVLSESEMCEVNKNVSIPQWLLYYEAYYYTSYARERRRSVICEDVDLPSTYFKTSVSVRPTGDAKKKKVYCYITPKFLTVKEYYLKIFPKKLHTFRIKPSVKIHLQSDDNSEQNSDNLMSYKCFTIESWKGDSLTLYCQHRNILVATFVKFMLENIGGSELFDNKKKYFYKELFKIGASKACMRITVNIQRTAVVKDTMKFVKTFSKTDWWKHFYIKFQGELGMDCGGLSREWMQLILKEMFNKEGGLFRRFNKDDQQALIHPNPYRIEEYSKLKYFEFAGQMVGKCLVECSCEQSRQQYARARFTRSFLSQLLGLGVSWKHFETDDKEYYKGKIKYILENDPTDLDVFFTEDVYDNNDRFIKTVDLKPNGSQIPVTEDNKLEYLQRLAEYRLAESVKQEIASFTKGLNGIVEEGLLSIFDENELELLICGMETISVSDMKASCEVDAGIMFSDNSVMPWFWAVISGFSQEELARLLQFITGCSQLPPTGFAGLSPKLQIKTSGGSSSLPISHTCFNMLLLPCYRSSEELKVKLLLAITEGSEGFWLT